ncbi:uncharacterized protein LOC128179058 isoform X2 [Crassostrea angulata]|uniref:uncharacterized protein LOC128179058 isoform X1 n=1 Tax=Magallana angulata TaxID=2784310 RepID=UPI0022B1309A|nr:uncharacterized protein LOC128179058 isoform X1 [Crassostrea angulata]XP_052702521.1 uncharacterized protein LOC128179058 isoform X2 [Crassostrea angulata]
MPEEPASVTKVISSTLKKLRYGGKSKSRKELESGKMEPGKVIQRQEIELQRCWEGKLVFLLHNVFTKKECLQLIKESEMRGFSPAMIHTADGKEITKTDTRNNYHNFLDSVEEMEKIQKRLRPYIPELWRNHKIVGLNERLRVQRYDSGEYFKPHFDAGFRRENGEKSFLSVQIFLNDDFLGGDTTFLDLEESERIEVEPRTGSVLIYQHDILHEDSAVLSGRKYALRTDVMYSAEKVEDEKELRRLRKNDKGKFGMFM